MSTKINYINNASMASCSRLQAWNLNLIKSRELWRNPNSKFATEHVRNFKFSIPQSPSPSISPAQLLQNKLCHVPVVSLDKLHPNNSDSHPFVEYVDDGIWKSHITFHKDLSHCVSQNKSKAERAAQAGNAFSNLDALCESELNRRLPNYTVIKGIRAKLKNKFSNVARLIMGTKRFYQELTQKEVDKYKKQIAYSACNRDDLKCSPKIEDPFLRQQLNLSDDSLLQTDHLFAKNSPMNGQSFALDGKTVHLSQAIACSNDRKVENTGNLRVVQTNDQESVCYTGRVDSDRKALEQAAFIFLNELKTKSKGITKTIDERGNTVYQLDYAVNSLLSIPWIWNTESLIAPFPEREYKENQRLAFLKLKASGPVTIEDPNCPGQSYQVKLNPILFSRSFNIFTRLENWLPPFFTGMSRSREITAEGYAHLKPIAKQTLSSLKQQLSSPLSEQQKQAVEQKIQEIESALAAQKTSYRLHPEEELLVRDHLCKLLNLPIIYHCKSSTDRTSIANALSTTLKQWMELKLSMPTHLPDLIKDYRFKELFAANWMAGHQITRYARGGEGTVAGETLNNKNLGLSLSRGIAQNPSIAHLLPGRYLVDFPTSKKLKISTVYLLLLLPITILFYIPLIALTAARQIGSIATLGKNPHWAETEKFSLQTSLLTFIFNFPAIFPDKVLNEHSAQVRARRLIAGG
jgi:hypothetical protein